MNQNETALITGASSGIGLEFARLLGRKGYNLVLVARDDKKLLDLKKELDARFDIRIKVIPQDLSKNEAATEIYNTLERDHLQIDLLINNAGFGLFGDFAHTDWNREAGMLQVNVVTLTHLTKLLMTRMIERKHGHILNVASTGSFRPGPMMSVYCASKAYVLSFSEAIAAEVDGTGVSVTALCPGPTDTRFNKTAGLKKTGSQGEVNTADPREVAEHGYRAMLRGKSVAIHGFRNKVTVGMGKLLPRQVVTGLVHKKRKRWRTTGQP
jgi:short-subunit dehydrogenase